MALRTAARSFCRQNAHHRYGRCFHAVGTGRQRNVNATGTLPVDARDNFDSVATAITQAKRQVCNVFGKHQRLVEPRCSLTGTINIQIDRGPGAAGKNRIRKLPQVGSTDHFPAVE